MVPRMSLPAITMALGTPGTGEFTTSEMKDSHFPSMAETSSLPEAMRESMMSELPMVPAMMAVSVLYLLSSSRVGPVIVTGGPTVYCKKDARQHLPFEPLGACLKPHRSGFWVDGLN